MVVSPLRRPLWTTRKNRQHHALCGVSAVRRAAGGVFPAEMERYERDEVSLSGHRRDLGHLRRCPGPGAGPAAEAEPGISNGRTASGTPCLHLSPQQPQHHAVYHAGGGAEYDHRPGDQEHFGGHAGDQALCLCQDRTHNFFAFLEFYDSVQL